MGRRILKYAILGLLSKEEMSGYDIAIEFQKTIGEFWGAKHSQIYIELKKLAEENLITPYLELSDNSIEKKIYRITAEGKEELLEWLVQVEYNLETEKDVFVLKLYFLKSIPKDEVEFLFKNQLKLRCEKLLRLQKQFSLQFGDEKDITKLQTEDFTDYLIITKAISREENYILWLNNSLELLRKRGEI